MAATAALVWKGRKMSDCIALWHFYVVFMSFFSLTHSLSPHRSVSLFIFIYLALWRQHNYEPYDLWRWPVWKITVARTPKPCLRWGKSTFFTEGHNTLINRDTLWLQHAKMEEKKTKPNDENMRWQIILLRAKWMISSLTTRYFFFHYLLCRLNQRQFSATKSN